MVSQSWLKESIGEIARPESRTNPSGRLTEGSKDSDSLPGEESAGAFPTSSGTGESRASVLAFVNRPILEPEPSSPEQAPFITLGT